MLGNWAHTAVGLYWKLRMSLRGLLAMSCIIVFSASSCAAAQVDKRLELEVPTASHMSIIDEGGTILSQSNPVPTSRLTLRVPVTIDGSAVKPANLDSLVGTLWEALSPEYRERLAAHFGFSKRAPAERRSSNLRLVDLSSFLFDLYDLEDRSTLLGRQIACVSSGERDLTPVFALVTERELLLNDGYTRRNDVPRDVTIHSALSLAARLAFVCREGM